MPLYVLWLQHHLAEFDLDTNPPLQFGGFGRVSGIDCRTVGVIETFRCKKQTTFLWWHSRDVQAALLNVSSPFE